MSLCLIFYQPTFFCIAAWTKDVQFHTNGGKALHFYGGVSATFIWLSRPQIHEPVVDSASND